MKKIVIWALSCAALLTGCSEDELPRASFDRFQVETVTATAGDGEAAVSWTAQAEKPQPLDYYVTWTPDNAQIEGGEATVEAGQYSLTVDGLVNDCTYTFAVQARYASGLSMKVTAFATPKSTRIAATNFKAMAGDGRVFLSWTAPETELDYTYRLVVSSESENDRTLTVDAGEESCLVEELTNDRAYTFALTCVYAHGDSETLTATATPGLIDPFVVTPTSSADLASLRQFELCSFEYNPAYFVRGMVTSVHWDFGDGGSSEEEIPLYAFAKTGTWTVTLTVTYEDQSTESATREITVSGLAWSTFPNAGYQKASQIAFTPDGQTLYTISQTDKKLIAVNAITGQTRWSYTTDAATYGAGPSVGTDGTVYFGTEDDGGSFYAVASSGALRWKKSLGAKVQAAPAVTSDGVVYALANDGRLYAFDAASGDEKWSAVQSGVGGGVVVDAEGTVYIGTSTGIWAYTAAGQMKWASTTAYVVTERGGSLALYDGVLYAVLKASSKGCVAVNTSDGSELWHYETTNGDCYHPAVDGEGTVYFCEKNGFLYAVTKTGSLKWKDESATSYIYSGFALDNAGTAYISQYVTPFSLLAFDASGNRSEYTSIGSQTMSPVTIGPDQRLYYGKNGEFCAIGLSEPAATVGWPMRGGNAQGSNSLK